MKKTLTINVSGIIFHIDEDAYNKLNAYLASIKSHFENLEGRDEIIADIESRIAEILQSKLNENKQVIVIEDINDVMQRMGEPSEFTDEDEDEKNNSYANVRTKRLYRDPEDKIIGGVASGIAAYFNIEPIWVRLIFVVSIFTTLGPFIYLILWLAVPEAETTAERLEMKGERVTISNIEKSLKKEFENLKEKVSDLGEEAKKTYKKNKPNTKNFFDNIGYALSGILRFFGKAFIILFGVILLIIGFAFTIGFLGSFFAEGVLSIHNEDIMIFPVAQFLDIMIGASGNPGLFKVGLILLFIIPVIMLIYHGLRMIIGFERIRQLGSTMFVLWLIGLAFTIFLGLKIARNFRYEAEDYAKLKIEQPNSNKININVNKLNGEAKLHYSNYFQFDEEVTFIFKKDAYYINQARLDLVPSKDDKFELIKHVSARGKSMPDARQKTQEVLYYFKQNGNSFDFDIFFGIPNEISWSDPEVELEFKIPVGTIIKMSPKYDRHRMLRKRRGYSYKYWSKEYFIMTEHGLEEMEEYENKTSNVTTKELVPSEKNENNRVFGSIMLALTDKFN